MVVYFSVLLNFREFSLLLVKCVCVLAGKGVTVEKVVEYDSSKEINK